MNNVVPQALIDLSTQELDAVTTGVATNQEACWVVESSTFKMTMLASAVRAFRINFVSDESDPKHGAAIQTATKKIRRSTKPSTHDTPVLMGEAHKITGGYFGLTAYYRWVVGKKVWIVAGHPFETETNAKFWAASYILARKTEGMDRGQAVAHASRALISMLAMSCGAAYTNVANVTFV